MAELLNASPPHGVKAIRHIRGQKLPSERQKKKINDTYEYFLLKVDPIVGACITHLLCTQPGDILNSMIDYLVIYKEQNGVVEKESLKTAHRPKKELRHYLATSIGPVVAKLVNRVAAVQPEDVIDFMCKELASMKEEDSMNPDAPEEPTSTTKYDHSTTSTNADGRQVTAVAENRDATSASANKVPPRSESAPEPKSIQIAIVGLDGAGKSSIVNMLSGSLESKMRPTIGFRPFSMMMGEDKVRFYDLGGGKKIRDIWDQYYHDVHGVIYVLDSARVGKDADSDKELLDTFNATMRHMYLQNKPVLVLANKQDLPDAAPMDAVSALLQLENRQDESRLYLTHECSSFVPEVMSDDYQPDSRIETALETLLTAIIDRYEALNGKVQGDVRQKASDEARKRIERERKVLKNKIASAFVHSLVPAVREALGAEEDLQNVFTEEEGLTFLAAEIGEESSSGLPDIAADISRMVGYQRLALQIIGALKAPISKKKVAMEWPAILELVRELREELQLPVDEQS